MDNNEDIAKMFGRSKPKIIDMVKVNKNVSTTNNSNSLKNVPPLLIIGIAMIVAAGFIGMPIFFTLGFCTIIVAMFDKVIPEEKKLEAIAKVKSWFKKKD